MLYQLTYDEVLVIDKDFEKQMSREDYDKLDYGFEYMQLATAEVAQTSVKKRNTSTRRTRVTPLFEW